GVFTAGTIGGLHTVRAEAAGRESIAEVRITTKDDGPLDSGDGDRDETPGQRVIRWRGAVPTQKWMNFYTKVLSRFAGNPELKLEVSFAVPLDRDQAKSKADDTRSGLKELGLDDGAMTG